ncbi:MAG: peptide ABC transporter substrate-binding protein [Acidobacteria bacterium]|nr:peptide ABC transporter substrate-binding protein [Acidobacteriota bacterium]
MALAVGGGCFSGDDGEQFYGRVKVPRAQEFRWSDGGLPSVFDPARASSPPDTDAVRALFEGLTELEAEGLKPVAGVAARWEAAEGDTVWTFYLRQDARWSNGDRVTAHDFVRAWRRTVRLGEAAPHARLLANVIEPQKPAVGGDANRERTLAPGEDAPPVGEPPPPVAAAVGGRPAESDEGPKLGAEAVDEQTLGELSADRVVLERERHYWNAAQVALERVSFVGAADAEAALSAYRAGEVDAVTNANVEPLGLKLLASYKDFRRTTFGALTYYDINATRPPFDDVRVRQALALAIDRQRLSADTLEGATEPAEKFLPFASSEVGRGVEADAKPAGGDEKGVSASARRDDAGAGAKGEDEGSLGFDPARARRLFAEAGYAGGANFPRVRLLINRNDQHRLVAEAIAGMWRSVLGVETEIMQRDWAGYELQLRTGEFDVAKRSHIMQSPDAETNLLAMFDPERLSFGGAAANESPASPAPAPTQPRPAPSQTEEGRTDAAPAAASEAILDEAQALRKVPAIPVYFASSYALVKPYLRGFDANLLDAPSLQRVRIDTNWQPPKREMVLAPAGTARP